jgi:hypothetical protein
MKFYTNKEVDRVISWLSVPGQFCGWSNLIHGGIIATLLDEAMGWGALVILQKLILSKSIAVDFINPVFTDTEMRVEGSVLTVNSEREAVLQGRVYTNDKISAESSSVVSLFTIETIRKMNVLDENMLGALEQLIQFKSSLR